MAYNYCLKNKPARAVSTIEFRCHASPALFRKKWEELSDGAKREYETNGTMPCEGGGVPGEWCLRCRFHRMIEVENSQC